MRVENPPPERARGGSPALRKPSLRVQFVLALGVAAILIVALILFVDQQTNHTPSEAQVNSPKAIVEQNREAHALVAQQQAPHTARARAGMPPAGALKAAIVAYLDAQIRVGAMNGPLALGRSTCTQTAASTSTRVALRCKMVTANVTYPYYGVVDPASRAVTFCQRVPPPVYGMDDVPLSPRCT